jgi:dihydrofolate reductase
LIGYYLQGHWSPTGLIIGAMLISLIVAMDREGGIGKAGRLPWHLSADMMRFKQLTMGHAILMGRKTYQSIGRALPGRTNIIITRQPNFEAEGCQVVSSLEDALSLASQAGESEVFVTGGGEIFAQALSLADRLYLTQVDTQAGCDVFFPAFDLAEWVEIEHSEIPADERNQFSSTFCELERKLGF